MSLELLVSSIDSIERFLRIVDGTAQLHIQMQEAIQAVASIGFQHLHTQLRNSIEILGVMQSMCLAEQLTSPNEEGQYFFQRLSWQSSVSLLSLANYSFWRNIKWLQKLEFVAAAKVSSLILGRLSFLDLAINGSYFVYRTCVALEGMRTQTWWKVAVAIGKIFVITITVAVAACNVHSAACTIGVIALNLILDAYILKRRICHV